MDPGYFTDAASTAEIAISEARALLAGPLGAVPSDARDLHQDIADKNLVIHARAFAPDGRQHAIGVHRPTGRHLLLSGSGPDRQISGEFTSGVEARRYFKAEVLREPPTTRKEFRADLPDFASALAAHLPVWTAEVRDITLRGHHAKLSEKLWDAGVLQGAFEQYVLHEAAVLAGPGGAQLVVVHRPGHRDQFLLGAVRPADLPEGLLNAHDAPVPLAISVGRDPLRAAAEVQHRFLPRYEQAVLTTRLRALAAAAEGINRALADWDAVSDSLCDEQGWPIDQAAYEEGLVARDAAAWEHVETFLSHAPHVLDAARDNLRTAQASGDFSRQDLWRSLCETDNARARASELQHEWKQVEALLIDPPSGSRREYVERARELRNSEGWHYASQLAIHAPDMVRAAQAVPPATTTGRGGRSARVTAALARSATPSAALSIADPAALRTSTAPSPRRSR